MLKIIGVTETYQNELSLNGYSLTIKWNTLNADRLLYWRVGNFKDSLIEVGISDLTHTVCEVTVVMVSNVWFSKMDKLNDFSSAIVVESGMPICEWTWDKPSPHIVDERLDFNVHVASNSLEIRLGNMTEITRIIEAGRVQFGVTKDESMSRIRINDLQPYEISKILTTFPSS